MRHYRIDQWQQGQIDEAFDFVRQPRLGQDHVALVKNKVSPTLRQYGGKRYLTDELLETFIEKLSKIIMTNPCPKNAQKIDEASYEIFGGPLLPPFHVHRIMGLRYFQAELNIDEDYNPRRSCCLRCIRGMDRFFAPTKRKQTSKLKMD